MFRLVMMQNNCNEPRSGRAAVDVHGYAHRRSTPLKGYKMVVDLGSCIVAAERERGDDTPSKRPMKSLQTPSL